MRRARAAILAGLLLGARRRRRLSPARAPIPPAPATAPAGARQRPADSERWSGVVAEPVTEALAGALHLSRIEGVYVRAVELVGREPAFLDLKVPGVGWVGCPKSACPQ